MRALFTGVSSFTGAWFARALAAAGFAVVGLHRRALDAYALPERRRLALVAGSTRLAHTPSLADPAVARRLAAERAQLLCLHGAEVGDHRAARFDVAGVLERTCAGLGELLDRFARSGGRAVLVTGSIFEADEGRGSAPLRAFNRYGLAKTLIWQTIRFEVERRGLALGKFVIAHPVGPLDKPTGLVPDLLAAWRRGEPAFLRRPHLIRDFLPVDGLALAYAAAARRLLEEERPIHLVPSFWPERVADFARRLAAALAPRLGLACAILEADPPEPSEEPVARVGLHHLDFLAPAWDPERFWDGIAAEVRGSPEAGFTPNVTQFQVENGGCFASILVGGPRSRT
ncbi:MAG: NAD-dependent epimerase/dehydratase family protein [Geminicoccaceae bacterium]|nr:NAD-dependent epimerase/dehydratase family protein [Geminicoccaceae bacterium]